MMKFTYPSRELKVKNGHIEQLEAELKEMHERVLELRRSQHRRESLQTRCHLDSLLLTKMVSLCVGEKALQSSGCKWA